MKIQLYDIVSVAAILSYFVPLALVLIKKLSRDLFFMLFAIYWTIGGLVNMCEIIPAFTESACYYVGVVYNIIDIPIILTILYRTTSSGTIRRFIPFAAVAIVCMEVIGLVSQGLVYDALKYSLGCGIAVVLFIVGSEIVRYMQTLEQSNVQNARMFIYAAVLFEYATFIVIYVFDYFVQTNDTEDSYLIYYFSTLGAILIASCGYLLHRNYDRRNWTPESTEL